MENYQRDGNVVKGSTGILYRAINSRTGQRHVIKEFSPAGVDAGLREISSLQQLGNNGFVINLVDHHYSARSPMPLRVVYEFIPSSLRRYLLTHRNEGLPLPTVRSIMFQLCLALQFIHGRGIMTQFLHRDLRSDNILVYETEQGIRLKLADFRSSKSRGLIEEGSEGLTPPSQIHKRYVVNLAPELLLGAAEYKPAVDIWSAGCIFAEIVTCGDQLFREHLPRDLDENVAQLLNIFSILGTPSLSERATLGVDNFINMYEQPRYERSTLEDLRELVPQLSLQGADLMNKMLQYIPETRDTASMLLQHNFFAGLNARQFQ